MIWGIKKKVLRGPGYSLTYYPRSGVLEASVTGDITRGSRRANEEIFQLFQDNSDNPEAVKQALASLMANEEIMERGGGDL
jgi:hypothetical protein